MRSMSVRWNVVWALAAVLCISCGPSEAPVGPRPLAHESQALSGWTGSLSASRSDHIAVLLGTGKVLVAGGWSSDMGLLTSAELYDPATGTWSATGSMSVPREYAAAVLLNDGRVLVTGGYNGQGTTTATAELYNPATGSWTTTGSMLAGRVNHSLVKLADGRVLAVGGFPSNTGSPLTSSELYNPTTGQWTQTGPTVYGHAYAQAFLQSDGKVVLLGGWEPNASSSVELYDPAYNGWSARSSVLVQKRDRASAVQLPDGRILLAGGVFSPTTAEIYNPATRSSSATGSLAKGRSFFTLSLLGNNQVLAMGGSGDSGARIAEIETYDIAAGTWSSSSLLMRARSNHTATPLGGSTPRVLVAGGTDTLSTTTTTAELYADAPADTTAPAVSITSPVAGATVKMSVTVSANASDNVGINRVEFYCDGTLIGTASAAPYSVSWGTASLANGSHTLTARAYDTSNNASTSAPVTVTTDNDKVAPTVSLTSPAPGTTVQGTVTLTATASDNVGVLAVYFYVNGNYVGSDSTPPYSWNWDTQQTANGTATVTVYAYDATYNSARADVSVTVNNPTPELITNGGFENTTTPWLLSGSSSRITGGYPASGASYNEQGGSVSSTAITEQLITLPANSAPTLRFSLNITTTESPSATYAYDQLYVEVYNSSTLLGTVATFSNLNSGTPGAYTVRSYSLAAYAGQSVRLRFRSTNDSIYPTVFRIDDVSVR